MNKKTIYKIYAFLIVLIILEAGLFFEKKYRILTPLIDKMAIQRVQYLALTNKNQYFNTWLGVRVLQNPTDLITYADLIYKIKPGTIIETGTCCGGLTLFLSSMMEYVNPDGKVISVDIDDHDWNNTLKSGKVPAMLGKRIVFIKGDSTSKTVVKSVLENITLGPVIVILDSAHNREHVLKELNMYSSMVTINSYIIVNDTSWDLTPFAPSGNFYEGSGPYAAVKEFMDNSQDFEIDKSLPRFFISSSPSGFLKRLR